MCTTETLQNHSDILADECWSVTPAWNQLVLSCAFCDCHSRLSSASVRGQRDQNVREQEGGREGREGREVGDGKEREDRERGEGERGERKERRKGRENRLFHIMLALFF